MKTVFGLFALLIIIALGIAFYQNSSKNNPSFLTNFFGKKTTVTIDKQIFVVTVAKSDLDKEKGLSVKNSIAQNEGMLFPFTKEDYYAFWMKDMKFSIDIIFINKNRIITIYQSVPAPKSPSESLTLYKPEKPADMVLEINAGLSQKYNFKKGDEVKIENL
ncbi:MAG: DUF192 domain-containing protein [Candidatus Levyibacteriota bacterium]